ncbi:hypothetical protein NDU88_000946 [Pleurodeles waltl]|uniref:Uncharacterized protein n=1 Tax=Pleurodeles waltl TaxID=8319 RepID=A0AAV7VY09_PLEWA|nr:hypothetical protein NDU88_000946 [Pleurodeles waltl]
MVESTSGRCGGTQEAVLMQTRAQGRGSCDTRFTRQNKRSLLDGDRGAHKDPTEDLQDPGTAMSLGPGGVSHRHFGNLESGPD